VFSRACVSEIIATAAVFLHSMPLRSRRAAGHLHLTSGAIIRLADRPFPSVPQIASAARTYRKVAKLGLSSSL
jgi:hypothetical protein